MNNHEWVILRAENGGAVLCVRSIQGLCPVIRFENLRCLANMAALLLQAGQQYAPPSAVPITEEDTAAAVTEVERIFDGFGRPSNPKAPTTQDS